MTVIVAGAAAMGHLLLGEEREQQRLVGPLLLLCALTEVAPDAACIGEVQALEERTGADVLARQVRELGEMLPDAARTVVRRLARQGSRRYACLVLQDVLAEHLAKVDGLVAAYLFGSRARGEARAASDVDVALWLQSAPKSLEDLQLGVGADLEQRLGVPVDVVILNGADPDLIHRVLRDGVLLVERDRAARVRFEVRARNDYFDLAPMRRAYRAGRRDGAR